MSHVDVIITKSNKPLNSKNQETGIAILGKVSRVDLSEEDGIGETVVSSEIPEFHTRLDMLKLIQPSVEEVEKYLAQMESSKK